MLASTQSRAWFSISASLWNKDRRGAFKKCWPFPTTNRSVRVQCLSPTKSNTCFSITVSQKKKKKNPTKDRRVFPENPGCSIFYNACSYYCHINHTTSELQESSPFGCSIFTILVVTYQINHYIWIVNCWRSRFGCFWMFLFPFRFFQYRSVKKTPHPWFDFVRQLTDTKKCLRCYNKPFSSLWIRNISDNNCSASES